MDQFGKIVASYYDELINEIDISTENCLINKNKKGHDEINSNRSILLEKVNSFKHYNFNLLDKNRTKLNQINDQNRLNNVLFCKYFCFFLPNNSSNLDFFDKNEPGKIVCLNVYVPETSVAIIRDKINKKVSTNDGDDPKDFEAYLKSYIIKKLLKNNKNLIIDLTDASKNEINELVLRGRFSNLNEHSFDYLDELINLEKLKYVEFGVYGQNSINKKLFQKFKWTEKLNILGNSIEKLTNHNFVGLDCLISIDISETSLEFIEPDAFDGLDNLKSLSFGMHSFDKIEKIDVSKLKNLETVSIYYNDVEVFKNEMIKCGQNLKKLTLAYNKMSLIDDKAFSNMSGLEQIILRCNGSNLCIKSNAFTGLKNLVILCLENNGIKQLEQNIFNDFVNLKFLSLRINPIKTIDLNCLENLEFLDLLENRYLEIDFERIFLPKLKFLQISQKTMPRLNNLKSLQGVEVHGLFSFEELMFCFDNTLSYVSLKFLNGEIYDQINKKHFDGLRNLDYLEIRIDSSENWTGSYSNTRDEQLKIILKNFVQDCDIYCFGFFCQINSNLCSKRNYLEEKLKVSQMVKNYAINF